jgi:hypothetical protein
VLRACRRLLRAAGRTAFLTIFTTPGLSGRDHRRAVQAGPRAVHSDREPWDLLRAAGFVDVEVTDLTREFLETARGWYEHASALEPKLRSEMGDEAFDDRQADRRTMIAAIEDRLLSRALLVATRPVAATR